MTWWRSAVRASYIPMLSLATHLVAYAIDELFPKSQRGGGSVSDTLFSYTFTNPDPLPLDFIPYIEEKLRGILKNPPSYRLQDMMGSNAAALLESKGQPLLAEQAMEAGSDVITLVKIGESFDLAVGEEKEVFAPFSFKLLDLAQEGNIYTISGVAKENDEAVKNFVKKWKSYSKYNIESEGARNKWVLFQEDAPIFLPKSMALREEIFDSLPLEDEAFPLKGDYLDPVQVIQTIRPKRLPLILRNVDDGGEISLLVIPLEEFDRYCRSSLQRIEKTVNILSFETQVTLCGLRPPNDVSERVKELWIQAVKILEAGLAEWGVPYVKGSDKTENGPELNIVLLDELGNRFSGPWFSIDCISSDKLAQASPESFSCVVFERSLLSDFDQLTLKMIQRKLVNRS